MGIDYKDIAIKTLLGLGMAALFIVIFIAVPVVLIYWNLIVLKYIIYPLTPIKHVDNSIVYLATMIQMIFMNKIRVRVVEK